MADYAIVEEIDGFRSIRTADGLVSFVEGSGSRADAEYQAWKAAGGLPDPLPAAEPELREITAYAFMMRFTAEERASIRAAAVSNSALADLYDRQKAAQTINLDDAEVIAGLALLEAAAIIGEGRAAEILS
jgi:hypothetical protein